jgi:hypothetical protein
MLISGLWYLCDDGVVRPVIRGEIWAGNGLWLEAPFLVDTAADRTVFSKDVLAALPLQPLASPHQLSGVGGEAASVVIETQIRLHREDSSLVVFRGHYAAFTDLKDLDMSVLGRDITNLFAVIIDRPGDVVCLLGQRHRYVFVQD